MSKAEMTRKSRITQIFEIAFFSDPKKMDSRGRWTVFLVVLMFLGTVYWIAREVYTRQVHGFAQRTFNNLASAAIEKIGGVRMDEQGDLIISDAEAYTHNKGVRRLFFRTRELRITMDGTPLRGQKVHVMRVDLHQPEIWVRREPGGKWNILWACVKAPRGPEDPEPPEPGEDDWKDYAQPDEGGFPRNGVYIHDGTIHVTFVTKSGTEVTWDVTGVQAALRKVNGVITMNPAYGDFYGGKVKGYMEIPKTNPFTISQITIDVRDADVAQMAAGAPFIKYPVTGKFNAVVATTYEKDRTSRPISAGHCEITEGNLWEFPVFAGLLNLLTLTAVSERRIDSAILEFTIEEDQVRIDMMHFLGFPMSLFGDGACSLTGDWIEVVFVPRLGKSDWNSIIPIIGTPIQWLADLFKGALLPVVLTGTFWKPEIAVRPGYFLQPSVKKLMEEKAPK